MGENERKHNDNVQAILTLKHKLNFCGFITSSRFAEQMFTFGEPQLINVLLFWNKLLK